MDIFGKNVMFTEEYLKINIKIFYAKVNIFFFNALILNCYHVISL